MEQDERFGYWKWNDEKNRLLFVGTQKFKKKKKKKGPSLKQRKSITKGRDKKALKIVLLKPTRPQVKRNLHSSVTMDDVKWVSLDELHEIVTVSKTFYKLFLTQQFDNFLESVLIYFNFFFDKIAKKEQPNPMFVEPSVAERTALAVSIAKIEIALHRVAKAYCNLILGLNLKFMHHLLCGKARFSKSYTDQNLFETLFSYCIIAVWITFKRKNMDVIHKEFNRLVRTEAFSPRESLQEVEEEEKSDDPPLSKLEEILLRKPLRMYGDKRKRLPLKANLDNRSRILGSLFPDPRVEANMVKMQPKLKKRLEVREPVKVDSSLEKDIAKISLSDELMLIGIIGQPFSAFNPVTLIPIFADRIEEEEEDKEKKVETEAENTQTLEEIKLEIDQYSLLDHNDLDSIFTIGSL